MKKTKKTKLLIISMTGGFGHLRAGEALLDYAKEHLSVLQAEHIDIANATPWSKKMTGSFYDFISKKFPMLWRMTYASMNSPLAASFLKGVISGLGTVFGQSARKYIFQRNADHFLFTNIILLPLFARSIRKKNPGARIGVVVTDYHGHSYFSFPFVDYYFVPHEKVKEDLKNLGIDEKNIIVSGIPINPRFYIKQSVKGLRKKYSLGSREKVVLCIASFKATAKELLGLVGGLLAIQIPSRVIVIANGNNEFYNGLTSNFGGEKRLTIVGWTNVIEEYIKVSDVVVSKAGGLTVTECLTLKKQMVVVNPIPGQEDRNVEFIESYGFGKKVSSISGVPEEVQRILASGKQNLQGVLPAENPSKKILSYFVK